MLKDELNWTTVKTKRWNYQNAKNVVKQRYMEKKSAIADASKVNELTRKYFSICIKIYINAWPDSNILSNILIMKMVKSI